MEWRKKERIQLKSPVIRNSIIPKISNQSKSRFESVLSRSLATLNNEERRAVKANKLEIERRRAMAITYSRHRVL